ncbi:MAG: [Fe-S]-binding protein, partial [Deltaproteobacteria bacterium]|nr:[Fe-S]-binding protein [Deltaproteobacteria bacterium]
MLTTLEIILFLLLLIGAGYFGGKGFYDVYRAIARGKPDARFDDLPGRIRRALWTVLTQRSVFKARPLVSFFHGLIFYGFVFYFLVNLVDLLEGMFGIHARGGLWNPFNLAADLLTAAVLLGVGAMVLRRFVMRSKDFDFAANTFIAPEARAGIQRDSAIVASFIFFHVGCRLMFKATQIAQQGSDGFQPLGSLLALPFSAAA